MKQADLIEELRKVVDTGRLILPADHAEWVAKRLQALIDHLAAPEEEPK